MEAIRRLATLGRAGKSMSMSDEALERLVAQGYSMAYGARFLKRMIDERIKLPLSERWHQGSHFQVSLHDGEIVVEPSPAMLAAARDRMAEFGATVTLVRGIAETLPFRDGTFDRVLCESAIDHFAHPDAAVREMTRVLQPEGRLVISFVNYGSVSTRISRLAYRAWRRGAPVIPGQHLFWDSPVPIEHTFECSLPVVRVP